MMGKNDNIFTKNKFISNDNNERHHKKTQILPRHLLSRTEFKQQNWISPGKYMNCLQFFINQDEHCLFTDKNKLSKEKLADG